MIWQIVRSMRPAVCLSALLLFDSAFARANDLEQNLRDKYQGKIFVLRGFYSDYQLIYDSAGRPNSGASPGDWTVDGFVQVDHIQLSGQSLKIKTRRLTGFNSTDGKNARSTKARRKRRFWISKPGRRWEVLRKTAECPLVEDLSDFPRQFFGTGSGILEALHRRRVCWQESEVSLFR
jgi:hypothetical protein